MKLTIVFTGGGTAGHVTPNLALIESLQQPNWKIYYMGSKNGIEKSMVESIGVPFFAIKSGKLRRYFSWKNFVDPLNVLVGVAQAFITLRKIKPDIVFSKGGFVALPVVVAAYLNRIPIIAHESDISPGLANRLSFPFVTKICVTFEAAKQHFKQLHKIEVTGTPIRQQLFNGDRAKGLALCHFVDDKPCILIVGGSLGSTGLNAAIRQILPHLLERYQVIHLCGKDKCSEQHRHLPGYVQLEYANEELADLLAASDVVVSRSGANALYELLALAKPHVLVPLSRKVSRGDQIQNAQYFQQQGISTVLDDDTLTSETLLAAIDDVFVRRDALVERIRALNITSATDKIIDLLRVSGSARI